jgi:hypothetical protein
MTDALSTGSFANAATNSGEPFFLTMAIQSSPGDRFDAFDVFAITVSFQSLSTHPGGLRHVLEELSPNHHVSNVIFATVSVIWVTNSDDAAAVIKQLLSRYIRAQWLLPRRRAWCVTSISCRRCAQLGQWDYYEVSETIPVLSHLFPRPSGFLTQ